jgi:hypothetical protein
MRVSVSSAVNVINNLENIFSIDNSEPALFNREMPEDTEDDDWENVWDDRQRGLEAVLGEADDLLHSPQPFFLGGNADVLRFSNFVPGVTYVTAELTSADSGQLPSTIGNYELVLCARTELNQGANLISRLASYTRDAVLEPEETMDIGDFLGDSSLPALLFAHPREGGLSFDCAGKKYGLLLCMGITADELNYSRKNGRAELLSHLQRANVFPYTDLCRQSVVR